MSTVKPPPKPVPMRWVVLAIAIFIAGYTYLRLHYAKRGRAFEPYHDMGEEVTVDRLLELGFQQIPVTLRRPAEAEPAARFAPAARIRDEFGGLPPELARALVFQPILPGRIKSVAAPRVAAGAEYSIQFVCAEPDLSSEIYDVALYRRGDQLFLLPNFQPVPGALQARSAETTIIAGIPLRRLAPGRYLITLCGRHGSKHWAFTVP
jgi:hypothetical protein